MEQGTGSTEPAGGQMSNLMAVGGVERMQCICNANRRNGQQP